MATTISNPASLSSVRFAFFSEGYTDTGSEIPGEPRPPAPANLNAYRRGGGFVPNTPAFSAIATGVGDDLLKLSQYSGFTVPNAVQPGTVYLEAVSISAITQEYNNQAGSALAGVRMQDSGEFQGIQNDNQFGGGSSGWFTLFNWRTGGATSFWSFRATQTTAFQSGSNIVNGTYTTGWVAASTLPQWDVAGYSNSFQRFGSATRIFTLELALTSDTSNVLASASISIQASSDTSAGEIE
jgi:hypothetical protein